MQSIGKQIVEGIWSGIKGAGGWLNKKISGFADGIVKGFQSAFKIKSPSEVMRDLVGKYIAQGIGVGIDENSYGVIDSAQNLLNTIKKNINGEMDINAIKENSDKGNSINALINKIKLPDKIKFELCVDGRTMAEVTAPFLDVINGEKIDLINKGVTI